MSSINKPYFLNYKARYEHDLGLEPINDLEQMNNILNTQGNFVGATRCGSYIVGSVSAIGTLSFAGNPTVHTDAHSARAECVRLAAANQGKLYIFVKLSGGQLNPVSSPISI